MRDLLEKLMQLQLNEAPVNPGERKGISFKLKKLETMGSELAKYKSSMSNMQYMVLPPALKAEMKQIEDKLNTEIEKVNTAYQAEYEKATVNDRPIKMDNLFKALGKNCKEIIKVYKELNRNDFQKEKFLFRGIRSSDDALYGKPFDARKPKDSNRELHELVNDAINNLGFAANRENSMFVTGDRSQASGYGNSLYILFPVDGFTFTWSQTVKDLVLDSSKRMEMTDKGVIRQLRELVKEAKLASKEPSDFPIYDPEDLFDSGYDYGNDYDKVIRAIELGALPNEAQDLLDNILTNKSIQEHFQFTDQNLFQAILSEKEIYVRGNYYAVNMEHKAELFKFLADIDTDAVEFPENFGEVPDILDKGDVVRILDGTYAGKLGTITYTYSDSYEVFINHKVGDTSLKKNQVELYKLPDGSIPLYEKGDEVIVTDPESRFYGSVVKLNFVYATGKVEFTDKNENLHTTFKNQIEPYSAEREQELLKDLETKPPAINVNDEVIIADPENEFYKERGKVNYIYSTGKIEVHLTKQDNYIDFEPNQLVLLKNAPPELVHNAVGVFKVGDKVQLIDGEYKGFYATVEYLYNMSDKVEVDLTGVGKKVVVPLSDMVHYGQQSTEPESTTDGTQDALGLKVGDMVKVTNTESGYYGQVGEVREVGVTGTGKDFINVKIPAGEFKTFPSWVEKVNEPQQPFKKNDKFKVKEKSFSVDGSIATVINGPDSDGDYQAVTDDGKTIFTSLFQMEKIEDTQPAFNVGDTVKIIDKSSGFSGMVGTISDEPDSAGDYTVTFDEDGEEEWTYAKSDEMEKVEHSSSQSTNDEIDNIKWEPDPEVGAPTQAPFKTGDRVEVSGEFPSLIGKKGTIVQTSPKYGFVSVQLDDNTAPSSFPVTALKKINDSQQTEEFHLGDMVEVNDTNLISYGQKGKVTDMDNGMLVIQDNITGDVFFAIKSSVKKIG